MKNQFSIILLLLFATSLNAQGVSQDFLRSTGKIYSVIAVLVLIIIGLAWYLIRLDSRIQKLEKTHKNG